MPRSYFSPYRNPMLEDGPEGEYLTDRLTDESIRLIRERSGDGPFFLNLCYYAVHIPIQSKPELVAKYEAKAKAMGLAGREAMEIGEPMPCLHKKGEHVVRRRFQSDPAYAAMVQTLDENIGRLMDALDEEGLAEDTIVIFTSDNGGLSTAEGSPTCNAPLSEGKGWMYEGGNREPLIVRWPGRVAADALCDAPVTSPDFYPTLLAAAGLDLLPEQHVDGESLLGLLTKGEPLERDAIFWHYPHYSNQGGSPACAIRCGDWKLIEFFEGPRCELYNVVEDVGETRDVAAEHAELTAQLRGRLEAWLEDVEGKIPPPNPDWPA
jgi:arylsulfatase A-like enzyme